jgi:hypothetical protein
MLSRTLRDRISGLVREGGLFGGGASSSPKNGNGAARGTAADRNGSDALAPDRHFVATGIEELLPGGVVQTPHGSVFLHERLYTELGERPAPLLERISWLCAPPGYGPMDAGELHEWTYEPLDPVTGESLAPDPPPPRRDRDIRDLGEITGIDDPPERGLFRRFGHRRVLYLDIETCGLSAAPVFLVGLCHVGDGNLVFRQLFARDYAEERALLCELGRIAREHDFLVTFNGKAFDVPFLRDRATHHRIAPPIQLPHLDLLWMARRRWKTMLPDCKLKTIEWRVLRRRRAGDVGGSEIPGLYHDYVKRGEAYRLIPVFHHNMLDVAAMVELTPVIFDPDAPIY